MRKTVPLLFIILLFFTTSCIEIVEEITVNADRSGTVSYRIEADAFSSLLSKIPGFTDKTGLKEKLLENFDNFAGRFKHAKGINNVKLIIGDDITDIKFSFDFTGTKELNKALYEIAGIKKTLFSPSYLKTGKHKLKKFNIAPYLKGQLKRENITIPAEAMKMIKYKVIYHLPSGIKSVRGKSFNISGDGKTVTQVFDFNDIYENKTNTGIKIRL